MNQQRKIFLVSLIVLLSLVFLTACAKTAEDTVPEPIVSSAADMAVIAEGEILPVADRALAFESGGILRQVFVEEGDQVRQGDVLAELDGTAALEAEKASLNYELLSAQQALDDLHQNADVDREQAWLAVLDARDAYDTAQKAYDEMDEDQYDDDLEKADEEIIDARQAVDDAKDDLVDYQDLDAENATRQHYEDAVDQAEDTLNEKLRARDDLQTAHDRIISQYHAAEAALTVAQAEYDRRQNGPDTDTLALIQSQVDSIQSQLNAAAEQLEKMKLTAPFDGEVVRINVEADEFAAPGASVILMADTSQWMVESTDLTELEVAALSVGQSVRMEAEAFPGEFFTGTVERIASYPETKQGDVLYTVRITVDDDDLPALRWGMTLTVTFD